MESADSELSPAIPRDALVVQLRENAKEPAGAHGHHSGVALDDFPQLGRNVGIVLDEKFIVVDIDKPDAEPARFLERRLTEHPTWQQKTGHGRHYLYRVPPLWKGTNAALRGSDGARYADIKTLGYIVAPGALVTCDKPCACGDMEYTIENAGDPQIAPDWLLELAQRVPTNTDSERVQSIEGIPYGEHDAFLIALAGWMRGRYGLAEDTIRHVIPGALSALEGYDEEHPYTEVDFARIARSAARYAAPDGDIGALLPEKTICAADIELITDPERWWVPGILPSGHLTMLYGAGGTGKSTFGSHLAERVTALGGSVYAFCIEESFRQFARRSVMAGAKRELLFGREQASGVQFPRDAGALRSLITDGRFDVIYFDSIGSHMDGTPGLNIAERTRKSLAPLAGLAQELGVAIVAVFHENKAGEFGGSVEMLNVARHVLHARRKPGGPLQVYVKKTNLEDPGLAFRFEGIEQTICDPQTGETQMVQHPGKLVAAKTRILRELEPIPIEQADATWNASEAVVIERSSRETKKAVLEMLPHCSDEEIAGQLDIEIPYVAQVRKDSTK